MLESSNNKTLPLICLLIVYIVILYSNTLQVPFILDDQIHITERTNLHLSELTFQNIIDTFFLDEGDDKKLYRPLSCLSFALNYYFGNFNITGYHVVNLIIHICSAIFLFKALFLLLNLNMPTRPNNIKNIAGLSAILWAIHPIQTQAVTYTVQRMASLSAMFYLVGIWLYLKFKSSSNDSNKKYLLLYSLLAFTCAMFSKENAILFPLSILCIELFFFNSFKKIYTIPLKYWGGVGIIILFPVLFFFFTSSIGEIISTYDHRPFTLKQRLLTEPRILFFYISQLVYPAAQRFSISHSFQLSDSLLSPFTTFCSISGILFILIFAFSIGRRHPLIGFPIIFFFINHLVESTVIPLELVYEHRNYLPSAFFFLPFSYGVIQLLNSYEHKKNIVYFGVIFFCAAIIFLFGISTHVRNNAWQSHLTLWESAQQTSPNLIRPYSQLGWYHTNRNRTDINQALYYFNKGLNKEKSYNVFEKAFLWLNIALTYEQAGNVKKMNQAAMKSLNLFKKEIEKQPSLANKPVAMEPLASTHYYLARSYALLGDASNAMAHIDQSLDLQKNATFYNTKAFYLINKQKYKEANTLLQRSLDSEHDNWETHFLLGQTLTISKNYSTGFWFYKQSIKLMERKPAKLFNPIVYLYAADNRYLSGDDAQGNHYLDVFIKNNSIPILQKTLNDLKNRPIKSVLFSDLEKLLNQIEKTTSIFK